MTQLFWTSDLWVSALTGYYKRGSLIMDLKRTAWHYAKTWGTFDILLVIMGWLFIILDLIADESQLHAYVCLACGRV